MNISFLPFLCLCVFLVDYTNAVKRKVIQAQRRRPFGQLPTSLNPVQYQLTIQPYFPADGVKYPSNKEFTFDAYLSIIIHCLDNTNQITLNILKLKLNEKATWVKRVYEDDDGVDIKCGLLKKLGDTVQSICGRSKYEVPVIGHSYNETEQQVVIELKRTLKAGRRYQINLEYSGVMENDALAGLYPSQYEENGKTEWLVVTQFESTDARRVIPSFDEPFYKAIFQVNIIHPTSMVAISNTMETSVDSIGNGWSITTFEPTLKMSTYLLAMAVCKFKSKTSYTADGNTLFRVWARPSLIDHVDYAVQVGPKSLDYYSQYFGIPFPLKKQDMLAIPDFAAGAMENWGMVTYRETALLYDNQSSTMEGLCYVATVISHELAHQWFGNLVTMEWWDDLWLNEGFATYMEYVGTEVVTDGFFRMRDRMVDSMTDALAMDQLESSHAIFVPVVSPDEINEIFDKISYSKGSAVIRMLNYTMGSELIQRGLQIYLTKHSYANANHNDLWSAFSQAIAEKGNAVKDWRNEPLNVTEFMNPWILQMGYPVLNVKRQYSDNGQIAIINQERFLISEKTSNQYQQAEESQPSLYNFMWYVPIFYSTNDSSVVESNWLVPEETLTIETSGDDQWLLVNHELAAYCRVNYDERNWALLAQQLQNDHTKIPLKNRIQLLEDTMRLARANKLSYKIALDLTLYLLNETEYLPWSNTLALLSYIKSMLMLTPALEEYKKYIAALTYPMYKRLGWNNSKEFQMDMNNHNLRDTILTYQCWAGGSECVQTALDLFNKFVQACSAYDAISSKCSPIPTAFRRVVYCEAVRSSKNTDNWDLLWSLYAKEQVPDEKLRLMSGLTCTHNPTLIQKVLNETIKKDSSCIRRQDGSSVISSFWGNRIARPMLWPFVEDNLPTIFEIYGSGGMLGLDEFLNTGTIWFNTKDKLEKIKKFYNKNGSELRSAKRSFEQTLEIVEGNVKWMDRNEEDIVYWLIQQNLPVPQRTQ